MAFSRQQFYKDSLKYSFLSPIKTVLGFTLILLLAFPSLATFKPTAAYADENLQKTAYELQQQVEEAQSTYSTAREEADKAAENVEEHERRIVEIEEEIPEQQKRTAEATRELYKFQQQSVGIINMLLSANSFGDFLKSMEYFTRISDANYAEINRLSDLKAELETKREELEHSQSEADARVEEAKDAMASALQAQAEVQQRIEEDARLEAEAAVLASKLAETPRDNNEGSVPETNNTPTDNGSSSTGNGNVAPPPSGGEVTGDEATFIANWAPRIDAYLAGSPMAGQGATFARAAYTYNVDPRFSPAIACTESGKGRYCFLPYNAWGWGSSSWGSWEEAIDAHVRGLSRGYGHTITIEGAKMYCPPNWEHWYNTTLSQMNLI